MNAKHCPNCNKFSFSSIDSGQWTCSTCGADLTDQRSVPAGQVDLSWTRKQALAAYAGR